VVLTEIFCADKALVIVQYTKYEVPLLE